MRPRSSTALVSLVLPVLLAAVSVPASAQTAIRSQVYVSGLTHPVAFIQDPSNPAIQLVVQQEGLVRVIQNGTLLATPFLDLTAAIATGGERGLLGLAFAPDYATSRRFFVYFTRVTDGYMVVARFRRSAGSAVLADPASRFDLVWSTGLNYIVSSINESNHNGGNIAFGPDGYLYIGIGDGGSSGSANAQNTTTHLGKFLRIDVDVDDGDPQGLDIPPDNPYLDNDPVNAPPELWSFGWRNPWRWSFDHPALGGTGALIVADVGQSAREEIDYEPANRGGRNYGWPVREGTNPVGGTPAYTPLTDPIYELDRTMATSITGGYVYRGAALGVSHRGRYFFANFYGRVYSIALTIGGGGEATASGFVEHTSQLGTIGYVSAFGVDSNGELYLVDWLNGVIRRVLPAANVPPAASLIAPSGNHMTTLPQYSWAAVPTATWYYLWVTDRAGPRIQTWYTAAQAGCGAGSGVCAVTPTTPVQVGNVTWWIQTWNDQGYGPWSAPLTFTPRIPGANTLQSPSGNIYTARPVYVWNANPLATYYLLYVRRDGDAGPYVNRWFTTAQVGCASGTGTCSFQNTFDLPPFSTSWWVQAWNPIGYGPFGTPLAFTPTRPGQVTTISPNGAIGTSTPAYTWNATANTTWYYLWVNDDVSGTPVIQQWFTSAQAGCGAGTGTCSVTPSGLPSGSYRWWIQTYNDAGYGPWSAFRLFVIP